MAHAYRILVDGSPVDPALYDALASLEIEESVELPGAVELTLPLENDASGEYAHVGDARFRPYANIAVVVDVDGKPPECVFDGYVLAHDLRLGRGTVASTLTVWGQDASWLMNLEEKAREWSDVTDGTVANAIFGEYGISPAPENTTDDSPSHTESGHTLMQRASDIQFLRQLARRSGKICRVAPGREAGRRTGYFASPALDGPPAAILSLNDPARRAIAALDIEWNVARPTEVAARQALFTGASDAGVAGGAADAGLKLLDARGLRDFAGRSMKAMLTAPVDDAGELQMRSRSLLRESGFFVRCRGEVDLAAIGAVIRAGTIVLIEGAGSVHSGRYYVWSVRHTIRASDHRMRLVLARNAVGPAPTGGGGGVLGGVI